MFRTTAITLAGAILALAGAPASAQIYVWPPGDFAPDGTFNRAFQMVGGAPCAAPGSNILISPGTYPERMRISEACRLVANGGLVRLGAGQTVTNLRLVSYNTHLFGDTLQGLIDAVEEFAGHNPTFGPLLQLLIDLFAEETAWADNPRAIEIGLRLAEENADVVCLQEVWDPDQRNTLVSSYQPANAFYGGHNEIYVFAGWPLAFTLNSGLLVMSDHTLMNSSQNVYAEEHGTWESFSTKSYVQTTIVKDGIPIGIFTTHTQAGSFDDQDVIDTRLAQMQQLMAGVFFYRLGNPTHPVVILGDMNVDGNNWSPFGEYIYNMRDAMTSTAATRDAAANLQCSPFWDACTSCADNELHHYFYPDEHNNARLDYFMYCDSLDGATKIRPVGYTRRDYEASTPISEGGFTARDLSDHYGIVADFQITR